MSDCENEGQNCGGRGFKLFGVQIGGSWIRKSKSLGNLQSEVVDAGESSGHVSDGSGYPERNKGMPWTEEEHRSFLAGLQELGKGNWKGISDNFVVTRNPTQVASHAQKYFNRKLAMDKRRRRNSIFDITDHHHSSTSTRVSVPVPQVENSKPMERPPPTSPFKHGMPPIMSFNKCQNALGQWPPPASGGVGAEPDLRIGKLTLYRNE